MLVAKEKIVGHLNRLYANGQIPEAVLDGALGGAATSMDQQLVVVVPPLPKVSPISPEPIGVVELDLIIRAISKMASDSGDVGLEYKENRLLAEQRHGGKFKFVTASPTTIATKAPEDKIEAIKNFLRDTGTRISLDQTTVQGVLETTRLLKADEIKIQVGRENGAIFVGEEVSHNATFGVESLKAKEDEAPYVLSISAAIFTAVLQQITDYSQAVLILTGEGSIIAVQEGEYYYIVSPMSEGS